MRKISANVKSYRAENCKILVKSEAHRAKIATTLYPTMH